MSDPIGPRRDRERRTIAAMIRLWCRRRHRSGKDLCPECRGLADYARERLARCPFGEEKPTCARCPVHCYEMRRRELVREMMRWAGPRMLLRHPVLAILHRMDDRRPPPEPRGR